MDRLTHLMGSLDLTMAFDRPYQIARHLESLAPGPKKWSDDCVPCANVILTTSVSAPNASWPIVPIRSDNLITINDIIRDGPARGGPAIAFRDKVLLCRSILPTFKINALHLLVDDPSGKNVSRLALYNFSKSVFPGTILAIMHPWLKFTVGDSMGLRCENPMHVKFIEPTDPILQNVIWKADLPVESGVTKNTAVVNDGDDPAKQGNRHYVEKDYAKALEYYTKAIELNPKNPVLFSNRALTYLALHSPLKALADTETGLALDHSHLKLLYRKAKALLMLNRYRDAFHFLGETFRRLGKELAGNREFAKLMENAKIMFIEFTTGQYDFEKIIEEDKQCKYSDHAEFAASSMFEIKVIAGKGRGLVATRDIPDGTHLLACKAFVYAPSGSVLKKSRNSDTRKYEDAGFTSLVHQICDKLMANPELGREFYQLYAGPKRGVLLNYDSSNPVDVDRIRAIVRFNNSITDHADYTGKYPDFDETKVNQGVWLLPSYFNHSCDDANCKQLMFGDFIFVWAMKFIKRGEELLCKYFPEEKPSFEERAKYLKVKCGFTCHCTTCVADRRRLGHE